MVMGADAVPELLRGGLRPLGAAGPDEHLVPGQREPAGQAASLIPGAAEDADDQSVDGRGFALSHGLHPLRRSGRTSTGSAPGLHRARTGPVRAAAAKAVVTCGFVKIATVRTDMAARRGYLDAP